MVKTVSGPDSRTSEEIIKDILNSQQDPKLVKETFKKLQVEMLEKLVKMGRIVCPHCGKTDCLVWSCCSKKVVK